MRVTTAQQNFSGGEISPSLAGRFDLSIYFNAASWMQNFISTVQGVGKFRSGSKFAWNTRGNAAARLVPFEFNTDQAYMLEFTALKMRIFKDGGLIVNTAQDITGITVASPPVVTYSGADTYANGDSVYITGVLGMTEVNNQEYTVANVNAGANTFELSGINGLGWTDYASGGTVAEIVEVTTPYAAADLFEIDYAQTADTMYIVHPDYAPYKLTRSSHTAWTLGTYSIIGNPFGITKAASQAITGATAADPCVITYGGADTYANGDHVYISGILGMTQLNGKTFTVANVNTGANTFQLSGVDSTGYTAYSSGGTVEEWATFSYPSVVAFFEQRLIFAASDSYPQRLWGSKGGIDGLDNFTIGTLADDAFIYTIASGKVNKIRWMVGTEDFLAIGTAGGEFKASGGGISDPITPTNVSIKPPSFLGSAAVKPLRLDSHIMYLQGDGTTIRSFEYDAVQDGYISINRTLTADHITQGRYNKTNGVKQMAYQSGNPNINWMVRNDGLLVGLTFEPKEQVNGWHRHVAGGTLASGKNLKPEYISIATIPQANLPDQVWTVVKRTINGSTVHYVEYFADQPNIPQFLDYYTDPDSEEDDTDEYEQDLWEAQKRLFYVDSGLSFSGIVSQTMVLSSAAVGTGVTATAGGATFAGTAADVGREIWGVAGGRARITAQSSTTVCTVEVINEFPSVSIASGDWYFTISTISGMNHLIGQEVIILADGEVIEGEVVPANASLTLAEQHSYVTVGLGYTGIFRSNDIEGGGRNGPAVSKQKSISQVGVKFLNSQGGLAGTSLYKMDRILSRDTDDRTDRPAPLFTGIRMINIRDIWESEKFLYIVQDRPLPMNLQVIAPYITTNDS